MTIKKLDSDAILIYRYDDIETVARRLKDSDLENAVLVSEDATRCDIAEWLCESPIDAISIVREMERLLKQPQKQPQKQLISYEKIPRDNIFETAVVSDPDYSVELTEILNIEGVEARKEKLIDFIDNRDNIKISVLEHISEPAHKYWFSAGDGYLYNFAYPFSQFLKD